MTLEITKNNLIKSTNKKLAIIGSATSSLVGAPWQDYSYDCACLAWRQDNVRPSFLLDIHRIDETRTKVPPQYLEWLKSTNVPVFLQETIPEVPNSVEYPFKTVTKKFGRYFVSSVAYAIALGILSGYETIGLWGVDLLDDSEYVHQKANCEFLLGWACGLGIKVEVPPQSALLKHDHLYGYQDPPYLGGLDEDVLNERIEKYRNMQQEGIRQAYTADGAAQEAEQLKALMKNAKRGKIL